MPSAFLSPGQFRGRDLFGLTLGNYPHWSAGAPFCVVLRVDAHAEWTEPRHDGHDEVAARVSIENDS